jgi:excisionase family DNA binding protein
MEGEIMETRELLTVREVAQVLRVHRLTPYGWVRDGLLPARRLATGRLRIARADLERFIHVNQPEGVATTANEENMAALTAVDVGN